MKNFKLLIVLLSIAIFSIKVQAQVPQTMTYQSVLRNINNALVVSGSVGTKISIIQGTSNGALVYVETQTSTTNSNGLLSLQIGAGTSIAGTFSAIDWSNGPYFIKTETDPTGGINYTIIGTQQMSSVPYALYATTSGNAVAGPQGATGIQGLTGLQGIQGLAGATGAAGSNGTNGAIGATGLQGIQGLTGATGAAGSNGAIGTTGLQGIQGLTGATGAAGSNGTNGAIGATGLQGIQGLTGATGVAGSNGTNGAIGATGLQGIQGLTGAGYSGITSTTSVTPANTGTIVLTTNLQGAFITGDRIRVVNTASNYFEGIVTITSGTIFSIVADYNLGATAATSWTFSLTGVRGVTGVTGATGPQGIQGATGLIVAGTTIGQMNYWNGTAWVTVAPGTRSSTLIYCDGVPTWGGCMSLLTTTEATSITYYSASSGGNITDSGGTAVTSSGICWSTTVNPTIALSTITTDGSEIGTFSSSMTGLNPGTLYYVRAYVTNSAGTSYGAQMSFTTPFLVVPTLSTTVATNVSGATASSGGSVSDDGGAIITSRGVCWSTTVNPTIALSTKTNDGTSTGTFTSSITGLNVSTLYHVRAYATNSVGTRYGNDVTFTTNTIVLGLIYLGGKIVYIDATGIHGLIVSTTAENTSVEYGCWKLVTTGATGTAIGTGNTNTNMIIAACLTTPIAASWCAGATINSYTDWYLPSIDELMQLYINRAAIGNFSTVGYWSSSEKTGSSGATSASSIDFSSGAINSTSKSTLLRARPVRSF